MGCELNLCWFYWLGIGSLEFVKNGRFTRFKSPRGRIVGSRGLPGRGLAYGSDTGSGMTLGEVTAMMGMITARPEESGSDYATGHE